MLLAAQTSEQIEVLRLSEQSLAVFVIVLVSLGLIVLASFVRVNSSWIHVFTSELKDVGKSIQEGAKTEAEAIRSYSSDMTKAISAGFSDVSKLLRAQEEKLISQSDTLRNIDGKLDTESKNVMELLTVVKALAEQLGKVEVKVSKLEEEIAKLTASDSERKVILQRVLELMEQQKKEESKNESI